jgi:predicted GNAT family N-acyltransferase
VAAEYVGLTADCRLTVTVRPARDAAEIEAAMNLRVRVFCDEQGVSREEELDGFDEAATHVVALDESGVVATCRLRAVQPAVWKLERMAVESRLRNLGVGGKLLAEAEREARARGATEMLLNAQLRAQPFYAAHGYVPEGETFMEAEIEHIAMRKAL